MDTNNTTGVNKMQRREFIKGAAVTSAGMFLTSCSDSIARSRKIGPNDKINVAQIGFGRIAHYDLGETIKHDSSQVNISCVICGNEHPLT